jgi:hypothetical protein
MTLTNREGAMLRLLEQALTHIQSELDAAGQDEVRQHPMLADKQRFVDKARKSMLRWRSGGAGTGGV